MITRIWKGWTTLSNAPIYESLLLTEIFAGIAARDIPGYRGISLCKRQAGVGPALPIFGTKGFVFATKLFPPFFQFIRQLLTNRRVARAAMAAGNNCSFSVNRSHGFAIRLYGLSKFHIIERPRIDQLWHAFPPSF